MKSDKGIVILSALLIAISSGCKKHDPDPSSSNNNYEAPNHVSAIINGTDWESNAPPPYVAVTGNYYPGNYFDFQADNFIGQGISHIYVKIFNMNDTGFYVLNDMNFGEYYDSPNNVRFQTDYLHTGYIHVVKFDLNNSKFSAEFNFVAKDSVSGDTVNVTQGKANEITFLH